LPGDNPRRASLGLVAHKALKAGVHRRQRSLFDLTPDWVRQTVVDDMDHLQVGAELPGEGERTLKRAI
jgi:hypothetical protein